jgi:hypothetical protein
VDLFSQIVIWRRIMPIGAQISVTGALPSQNHPPGTARGNFTFVTNNARNFRKLYAKEELHAGLVIIVPQVLPARQREMFDAVLDELANSDELPNEIIEISVGEDALVITRYVLPEIG